MYITLSNFCDICKFINRSIVSCFKLMLQQIQVSLNHYLFRNPHLCETIIITTLTIFEGINRATNISHTLYMHYLQTSCNTRRQFVSYILNEGKFYTIRRILKDLSLLNNEGRFQVHSLYYDCGPTLS